MRLTASRISGGTEPPTFFPDRLRGRGCADFIQRRVRLCGAGLGPRFQTYGGPSMRDSAQVTSPGASNSMIAAMSTRPTRQNRSTWSRMSVPIALTPPPPCEPVHMRCAPMRRTALAPRCYPKGGHGHLCSPLPGHWQGQGPRAVPPPVRWLSSLSPSRGLVLAGLLSAEAPLLPTTPGM